MALSREDGTCRASRAVCVSAQNSARTLTGRAQAPRLRFHWRRRHPRARVRCPGSPCRGAYRSPVCHFGAKAATRAPMLPPTAPPSNNGVNSMKELTDMAKADSKNLSRASRDGDSHHYASAAGGLWLWRWWRRRDRTNRRARLQRRLHLQRRLRLPTIWRAVEDDPVVVTSLAYYTGLVPPAPPTSSARLPSRCTSSPTAPTDST